MQPEPKGGGGGGGEANPKGRKGPSFRHLGLAHFFMKGRVEKKEVGASSGRKGEKDEKEGLAHVEKTIGHKRIRFIVRETSRESTESVCSGGGGSAKS